MPENIEENLSPRQKLLKEIEYFAGLMYTLKEVQIITGFLTEDYFSEDIQNSYQRGQLLADSEVRKSIMDQAKSGSAPAQAMAAKLLNNLNHLEP